MLSEQTGSMAWKSITGCSGADFTYTTKRSKALQKDSSLHRPAPKGDEVLYAKEKNQRSQKSLVVTFEPTKAKSSASVQRGNTKTSRLLYQNR